MFLDKYIRENGVYTDYLVFGNEDHVDLLISTKDLFLAQYRDNIYNAVDIVVKYLAIENFYGLNDFGFELYKKTQILRTNKDWEERFKNLIKSIEFGYDRRSFVETDLNYSIHDGAHRVALGLFHGINELSLRLFNTNLYRRSYSLRWFLENDYTDKEVTIINDKLNELLRVFNEPYYCILWSPARNIFDQIEKDINEMGNGIEIVSSEALSVSKENFKKFIYDVYSTDDIKKEKLDLKYCKIINSLESDLFNEGEYPIKILKIHMDNPNFRVKPLTGLPQSKTTMEIKTTIRDKYKKFITDYYYDIIMHVTDNTRQNQDVDNIIKKIRRR